jgi:hypothetical protein
MTRPYFRQVPNFNYVSRTADEKEISNYSAVKNLFKRGKLREDIFGDLNFFTKYDIVGDDRPDNVAFEIYNDSTLDWVILLANNILNIQTEWPMSQQSFDTYLIDKYGTYDVLYSGIHHYETQEVKDTNGITIVPQGLEVQQNYSVTYYDSGLGTEVTATNITDGITNYQYEDKIQDDKRHIFVLKPTYLNVVFNDLDSVMKYKKGGAQYVNPTLKQGDNIRLYE